VRGENQKNHHKGRTDAGREESRSEKNSTEKKRRQTGNARELMLYEKRILETRSVGRRTKQASAKRWGIPQVGVRGDKRIGGLTPQRTWQNGERGRRGITAAGKDYRQYGI